MRHPPPSHLDPAADASVADFAAGTADSGLYLFHSRSEVILAPSVVGDFGGPELPPGWDIELANSESIAALRDGCIHLDGAGVYGPGSVTNDRAVEFSATFAPRPGQHAGLGLDFVAVPWISFSTKFGNALYARTHFYLAEDERLPGELLGQRHRFRIDWNVLDMRFSVEGEALTHLLVPMPAFMRLGAASTRPAGQPLQVEWMLATPYRPAGELVSRVFDAGSPARWDRCQWDAATPRGTEVAVAVRAGSTPAPDGSWSAWTDPRGGGRLGLPGRYAQYRARLRTTDPRETPALRRVSLGVRAEGPPASC